MDPVPIVTALATSNALAVARRYEVAPSEMEIVPVPKAELLLKRTSPVAVEFTVVPPAYVLAPLSTIFPVAELSNTKPLAPLITPFRFSTPVVLVMFKATPLALVFRAILALTVEVAPLWDPKKTLLPVPMSTLMGMLLEIVPPLK